MSFIAQIIVHLKRVFLGLWRQKKSHLLELLYCLMIFYVNLLIVITIYAPQVTINKFDLVRLLEHNEIFTNDIKYFQSLNINTKTIKFKEIKQQETIEKFIEEIYSNAYLNIGKAGIQIKKVNETEILFSPYILKNNYNTVFSFSKIGIKLDVDEFMMKYSNIFWDSLWYFKLNNLEYDFMMPYYYKLAPILPDPRFNIILVENEKNVGEVNDEESGVFDTSKFQISNFNFIL